MPKAAAFQPTSCERRRSDVGLGATIRITKFLFEVSKPPGVELARVSLERGVLVAPSATTAEDRIRERQQALHRTGEKRHAIADVSVPRSA